MDLYWLEQTEADVPPENDWLSAAESILVKGMRIAKRRADWRLGRWTAKRALASLWNKPASPLALAEIEICPAPTGAPEVRLSHSPAAVSISISHRAGRAMCAVSLSGGALGCDLEIVEPRTEAFVADYFVSEERELVARARVPERFQLLALLWSGKECALKALRTGLRLDTRSVVVMPTDGSFNVNGWSPLRVWCSEGQVFHGWWQRSYNVVRTLVAAPPPTPPILLEVEAYFPQSSFRQALSTGD
jgi:4'-phosphopantetheinyl transferase